MLRLESDRGQLSNDQGEQQVSTVPPPPSAAPTLPPLPHLAQRAHDEAAITLGCDYGASAEVDVVEGQVDERRQAAQTGEVPHATDGISR